MVYDALLVLALWMFTLFPVVAVAGDAVAGPPVRALLFLELYAFFVFFWMRKGQTLGMLAWRLELANDRPGPLTLSQMTLRFIGAGLSFAALGLGYLWILVDPARRSWSDRLSASRVRFVPRAAGKARFD